MVVTVIGLGLMGGSLSLAIKEVGFSKHIIGVDDNVSHCKEALKLNLIEEVKPLKEAILKSDLIIVATPVAASISIVSTILDTISGNQVIVDLGSTKAELCAHLNQH